MKCWSSLEWWKQHFGSCSVRQKKMSFAQDAFLHSTERNHCCILASAQHNIVIIAGPAADIGCFGFVVGPIADIAGFGFVVGPVADIACFGFVVGPVAEAASNGVFDGASYGASFGARS